MNKKFSICCCAFLISFLAAFAAQASAQIYSQSSDGKDFFIGYVQPSYNKVADPTVLASYGAYLLISSYSDNHVTVTYFDKTTGAEQPGPRYFIPSRTGIQVPLNLLNMMPDDTGDIAEFRACHITSDRPVNVQFFSSGACAGGSYLALQTAALGKKYVIASYQNNPGELGIQCSTYFPSSVEDSRGFFEIIAAFDGTTISITSNSTTMGGYRGYSTGKGASHNINPHNVQLRRGQIYFVKSASTDNTDDISNSIVESDKPIAVIAGHENAAIGGVSTHIMEGRNFMVQQMYPYEVWDTSGYVMIPLKDSQPADPSKYEGVGENYRVFTLEIPGSQENFYNGCIGQPIAISAGKLQSPPTEFRGVTCPVDIEATNGVPFTVMMYDQRNVATAAPYPAPSMMTVIPISKWKTSYLWYVPANKFETMQGYYVDVIAPDADFTGINGIIASFNGGPIKPIKAVLGVEQQWKIIPNHPGLTGDRFKLYPGSYYATGPHPFIVYNFGFRGLDPDSVLGDLDCDNYFFSYGTPTGLQIGSGMQHMRVTVDTFCSYWNVCVHDSTFGLTGQGIKSVTILADPTGDFVKPGKLYYNTRLDDSLDPFNTGDITLTGNDSDLCFKVMVTKPIDSADAPLFISDDQGNAIIVDLHYAPPLVKLTPDSGRYLLTGLENDSCIHYVFKNQGKIINRKDTSYTINPNPPHDTLKIIKDTILHSGKSFMITSDNLKLHNPNFTIAGTVPSLPATIKPGDSLVITTCFNPKDTLLQRDTIELVNDCFTEPIDLAGNGATALIVADDHDFGAVIVDSTKCAPVGVKNVGNAPFILTKQWLMEHYGINFTFPDSSSLPVKLNPGQKITLDFCYTPHSEQGDSTVMHWGTNLLDPYKHSIKDTSIFFGRGVSAGFAWDRNEQTLYADSTIINDSTIARVWLLNDATDLRNGPTVHVNNVFISGTDASEFYILYDRLARIPLQNFDLFPGDSIWIDVVFKPDVTKPYPQRYADRHADLIAHGDSTKEKDQIINLTGTWAKNGVALAAPLPHFTIYPNPVSGNSVIISFGSAVETRHGASLQLYDVLGREVYSKDITSGTEQAEIPLRNLNAGSYYVRFITETGVVTQKLEVVR